MLTIQPRIDTFKSSSTSFTSKISKKEEEEYNETRGQIEKIEQDILEMADKAPEPVKKAGDVLSIGATSILGGMAVGWGGKKSLAGIREVCNGKNGQKFIKSAKETTKKFVKGVGEIGGAIKSGFVKMSEEFKKTKLAGKINEFFTETKVGKKIVSIKNAITNSKIYQGTKEVLVNIKDKVVSGYNKVMGVKAEQVDKTITTTLGITGGIASGEKVIREKYSDNPEVNY
ncbi:MAG: hypothetical protein R3Y28_00055 [Candidatus Gastranaerophilales bacterium]